MWKFPCAPHGPRFWVLTTRDLIRFPTSKDFNDRCELKLFFFLSVTFSGTERKLCTGCAVSGVGECAASDDARCFRADVYEYTCETGGRAVDARAGNGEGPPSRGAGPKESSRKSDLQPPGAPLAGEPSLEGWGGGSPSREGAWSSSGLKATHPHPLTGRPGDPCVRTTPRPLSRQGVTPVARQSCLQCGLRPQPLGTTPLKMKTMGG